MSRHREMRGNTTYKLLATTCTNLEPVVTLNLKIATRLNISTITYVLKFKSDFAALHSNNNQDQLVST